MTLDDWEVPGVEYQDNDGLMHMEQVGNIDSVNGKTGNEVQPIEMKSGELAKLRLIGSSTALTQKMEFPTEVRVTHKDGRALQEPYKTKDLEVAPGERYDVELQMGGTKSSVSYITNQRDHGLKIPIAYITKKGAATKKSPFVSAKDSNVLKTYANRNADIEMVLSDGMVRGMQGHQWTINDEVYPNLDCFNFKQNETYVIRFTNESMHTMDHPMHIHGAHVTLLSVNGEKMKSEVYKDTINVPDGGYVDVAIRFDKVGQWMVHCHILDHEDGGMMTAIEVQP